MSPGVGSVPGSVQLGVELGSQWWGPPCGHRFQGSRPGTRFTGGDDGSEQRLTRAYRDPLSLLSGRGEFVHNGLSGAHRDRGLLLGTPGPGGL